MRITGVSAEHEFIKKILRIHKRGITKENDLLSRHAKIKYIIYPQYIQLRGTRGLALFLCRHFYRKEFKMRSPAEKEHCG